ncbi:MAG TPA: hypothetical protein PLP21_09165 [Pyrinomonadaceae bacterium]|nr:hypothetical protein [Acidobacteriota bacterium]HQZ96476.1 hypothetical protein [Pyrinomonadaceae bacterium]
MRNKGLVVVTVVILACVGCWSVGSKAEPNTAETLEMKGTDVKKGFLENLPKGFEQPADDAGRLLLREYGAVFLARNGAIPPKKVVFRDEADVTAFQSTLQRSSESIGGTTVELQAAAMSALQKARAEAQQTGLSISPRGADSARRGYNQTVSLWASRVNPGFVYWVGKGRVTQAEANRIKALSPYQQVPEILRLEQSNIFFAKSLDKSIIYSVAPPGTSQHLSMLALDVEQNENGTVRTILAKNGWFQTVVSDLPHFTYIGVKESELAGLGLKEVKNGGRTFWIPEF